MYVEKTLPDSDDTAGEAAYWGTRLEDVVAREWGKRNRRNYGVVVPSPGLLAHPKYPWMLATLDREVAVRRSAEPYAALECKTTDARNEPEWREDAPPPDRVVVQVEHQLAVTGLEVGYVAALVGGNTYRQWVIERDDELIDQIIDIEAEFWDMVTNRVPPAPIGRDADHDALLALYPGDPDRDVVLDDELLDDLDRVNDLTARIKEAKAAKQALCQRIQAAMGDATEGLRPDRSTACTWRTTETTRVVPELVRSRHPEILGDVSETTAGRRFLAKKATTKGAITNVAA